MKHIKSSCLRRVHFSSTNLLDFLSLEKTSAANRFFRFFLFNFTCHDKNNHRHTKSVQNDDNTNTEMSWFVAKAVDPLPPLPHVPVLVILLVQVTKQVGLGVYWTNKNN